MFQILGVVGIAISVAAYVPQVVHLGREHCSCGRQYPHLGDVAGERAAGVGALAVYRRDPVFILLQLSSLTSTAVILFLARKYKGMTCETHAPCFPDADPLSGESDIVLSSTAPARRRRHLADSPRDDASR